MNKIIRLLGIMLLINSVSASANTGNIPIQLQIGYKINQFSGVPNPYVTVISKSNNITVNNVIINRGECKVIAADLGRVVRTLKFGQSVVYRSGSNCQNVLEVVVETNQGQWTFTPNN